MVFQCKEKNNIGRENSFSRRFLNDPFDVIGLESKTKKKNNNKKYVARLHGEIYDHNVRKKQHYHYLFSLKCVSSFIIIIIYFIFFFLIRNLIFVLRSLPSVLGSRASRLENNAKFVFNKKINKND